MNVTALRDQAAKTVREQIGRDRDAASEDLKPILVAFLDRFFDPELQRRTVEADLGITSHRVEKFSEKFGKKPWIYLSDRRCEVGAKLLRDTHLRSFQVAVALGYGPRTFGREFRRWSGRSPNDYRKDPPRTVAGGALPSGRRKLLRAADRALAVGAADAALEALTRSDDQAFGEEARRALAYHCRGSVRARSGDIDRAYEDLAWARHRYEVLGALPRSVSRFRQRCLLEPCSTDDVLYNAFCDDCRPALREDPEVRHVLLHALSPFPTDLATFRRCCDPCYRRLRDAVDRAQLGLMDDAFHAWWISESADLEDREAPVTRGRCLAALAEVAAGTFGDQAARKRYADFALADAEALGDRGLGAVARIWRACVLRGLALFREARAELRKAAPPVKESPWLAALHLRMLGLLEIQTNNYSEALKHLRAATKLYERLDRHTAGLLLIQEGVLYFFTRHFEASIARNEEALSFLDSRWNPLPANVSVPKHLAIAYGGIGRWSEADAALQRCHFDRSAHPGRAAAEVFARACLKLGRGRLREAVRLFADAKERFEQLHRPLDVALAASYSVEAYARLGERAEAIEKAAVALSFFEAAGCGQDSIDELGKLQALLAEEEIDVEAVTLHVRRLAGRHGGWLPEHGGRRRPTGRAD